MVLIKLPLLLKFRHLSLKTPQALPKRSVVLKKIYTDYEQKIKPDLINEKNLDVPLGPTIDGVPVRPFDINNENHFKAMTMFVQHTTSGLLSDDPYDRILLNKKIFCCGQSLKTVLPGKIARLYTTSGTKSCLVLKSSCSKCGLEFWPGFEQLKKGDEFYRTYHNADDNNEFFCSTRASVFEIKYLKQVTATSEAGGLPFVDHADIYNISQQIDEEWRRMDRRQLLVAFLLWNISWRLPGVPLKCRMTRREFDSEFFCVNAYPVLRAKYKTWTKHKCQNKLKGKKKRDDDDEYKKKQDDDMGNQPKKLKISKNEPRSSNICGSEEPTTDTGVNRCRMCKQVMDCEDTLMYTGHPNDSMHENVGLSVVQDNDEISDKQLSVRLNNCAIYDGNQHIIPYSIYPFFIKFLNNLIDQKSDLFFSGFIEKNGVSEIQEGVPIYDCGPIIRCWSDTYVGCDLPYLVLKTPLAEYYAINSSPMYAPLMTKGN